MYMINVACIILFVMTVSWVSQHCLAISGSNTQPSNWAAISSVVECPPPNWKIVWSIHGHRLTSRSAPWTRAFTATAPTKSSIQASACSQLSLNKSVAVHAINKNKHCLFNCIYTICIIQQIVWQSVFIQTLLKSRTPLIWTKCPTAYSIPCSVQLRKHN